MPEILHWWNLVFVLAVFFAFVYAALNAFGLGGHGGILSGADLEADHDVDLGAAAGGASLDAEHLPDLHVDHGVHVESAPSLFEQALSFFGIGKVPLSVILMTFLITFGVVGWAANQLLEPALAAPIAFFPISLAAAIACGLGSTKALAATVGRYLRPIESAALWRGELAGRIATASLTITAQFGTALVRDEYGTLHKVLCRAREDAPPIAKGSTVLLVRYVPVKEPGRRPGGYYVVEPYHVPAP
ncbi:MAG TPA: DUF1449 family protein [Planctomycetota bacterium]|nr:DUF1449 family protein [Planctomycetota bacterium]HRR80930.1 DUF1449 family protein [Planctomycetota bacterium]HRT93872.1 DUF1449 family protein [Planctomycetota bacterium]